MACGGCGAKRKARPSTSAQATIEICHDVHEVIEAGVVIGSYDSAPEARAARLPGTRYQRRQDCTTFPALYSVIDVDGVELDRVPTAGEAQKIKRQHPGARLAMVPAQ